MAGTDSGSLIKVKNYFSSDNKLKSVTECKAIILI